MGAVLYEDGVGVFGVVVYGVLVWGVVDPVGGVVVVFLAVADVGRLNDCGAAGFGSTVGSVGFVWDDVVFVFGVVGFDFGSVGGFAAFLLLWSGFVDGAVVGFFAVGEAFGGSWVADIREVGGGVVRVFFFDCVAGFFFDADGGV